MKVEREERVEVEVEVEEIRDNYVIRKELPPGPPGKFSNSTRDFHPCTVDMSRDEANAMDEIIPNLWIGDLRAATDEHLLREHNIHSVLSAMRGRVKVHEVR